jgi:hypothetical protein
MNKALLAVLMTVATFTPAAAQTTSDCQQTTQASARLACYDKIAPPISAKKAKKSASKTLDTYESEERRMKKVLAPICRNC